MDDSSFFKDLNTPPQDTEPEEQDGEKDAESEAPPTLDELGERRAELAHLLAKSLPPDATREEAQQLLERNLRAIELDAEFCLQVTTENRPLLEEVMEHYGQSLPPDELVLLSFYSETFVRNITLIEGRRDQVRTILEALKRPVHDFDKDMWLEERKGWRRLLAELPFDFEEEQEGLKKQYRELEAGLRETSGERLIGRFCSQTAHDTVRPLGMMGAAYDTIDFLKSWFSSREVTPEDATYLQGLIPRVERIEYLLERTARNHLEMVQRVRGILGRENRAPSENA